MYFSVFNQMINVFNCIIKKNTRTSFKSKYNISKIKAPKFHEPVSSL